MFGAFDTERDVQRIREMEGSDFASQIVKADHKEDDES
jgi:hypothetical protein